METNLTSTSMTDHATSMLPPATGSTNINVGTAERVISAVSGAALALAGIRNLGSVNGIALAIGGGFLLARGLSGYCAVNQLIGRNTANKKASAMEISGTFTINKSRPEVYAFWRRLENLPQFMKHLTEVKQDDHTKSTWSARIPGGIGTVSWQAEITEDRPGELITWASLPGSTVDNAGEILFNDAPGNQGTEIKASITYRLPAGDLGGVAAKLFSPVIENMMKEDLNRFKSIIESGEVRSIEAQTFGEQEDKIKGKKTKKSKATGQQNTGESYEGPVLERD